MANVFVKFRDRKKNEQNTCVKQLTIENKTANKLFKKLLFSSQENANKTRYCFLTQQLANIKKL